MDHAHVLIKSSRSGSLFADTKLVNAKEIREPKTSKSSLAFIHDDEEDEDDKSKKHIIKKVDKDAADDDISRHMRRFEIHRIVQNLLVGDTSTTVCQLILLHDLELDKKLFQDAFNDHHGIEVLVNLLEVNSSRCNFGAIKCIEKMCSNNKMRLLFANLGAVPLLVELMNKPDIELNILTARALRKLCKVQKPARYLRKIGGISILLDFLDVSESILYTTFELLTEEQKNIIKLACAATGTLREVSKYPKSKPFLHRHGLALVMKKIANCCHRDLLVEFLGLLTDCAEHEAIRRAIEEEGILIQLLKCLHENDQLLKAACASTIARCASDSTVTRHMVRLLGGLKVFVALSKDLRQPEVTLAAVTRAIAKLCLDHRNLRKMSESGVVHNLIRFLKKVTADPEIMSNILEGLAQCGRLAENAQAIANADCIPLLVAKLYETNSSILAATAQCVGACARNVKVAEVIVAFDGMRLLFSVLQKEDPKVISTALWALRPLIQNSSGSAEEIRCMVGGLSLLIRLLSFDDLSVKSNACGLVAEVGKDPENLYIMSDCGVVTALAECAHEKEETLRLNAAEAIACTAALRKNATNYGLLGVVVVMTHYLKSQNVALHVAAMRALEALTQVPFNCIILHESGGLHPTLDDASGPYRQLQRLATNVLRNMRTVCNETYQRAFDKCDMRLLTKLGYKRRMRKKIPQAVIRGMEKHFFEKAKRRIKVKERMEMKGGRQSLFAEEPPGEKL